MKKSLSRLKECENCEFIITMGPKGALYDNKMFRVEETEVFDVCGAGDVFLSGLVYGYLRLRTSQKPFQLQINVHHSRK